MFNWDWCFGLCFCLSGISLSSIRMLAAASSRLLERKTASKPGFLTSTTLYAQLKQMLASVELPYRSCDTGLTRIVIIAEAVITSTTLIINKRNSSLPLVMCCSLRPHSRPETRGSLRETWGFGVGLGFRELWC